MSNVAIIEARTGAHDAIPDSSGGAVLYWRWASLPWGEPDRGGAVWHENGVAMRLHHLGHHVASARWKCPSRSDAEDVAEEEATALTPWLETLAHLMAAEAAIKSARNLRGWENRYREACDEADMWGDHYTQAHARDLGDELLHELRRITGEQVDTEPASTAAALAATHTTLSERHLSAALGYAPDMGAHPQFDEAWEGPWARDHDHRGQPSDLSYFTAHRLLRAWALTRPAVSRDTLVRWAIEAGVTKALVSQLTGLARTTIDRIATS
ncbi:hypothetical protein OOK31_38475 [Streptomyces sp. NBC_00249]|uniref:hypothetical protein n=1 Tax=Streptomyces sp. NBC_00249 TaxID=2975690 RepID=UPI0022548029|nr:hypothetical protein [Streptomyces sp. NBC_00249]MCX5199698.1 hypothetical protein [Streptomyces sp. NBC_00249]